MPDIIISIQHKTQPERYRAPVCARAKTEDIEMAARAVQFADRARIHVFLASSDLHLEFKLKISRAQALDLCGESVRLARSLVNDVEFSPEDATRST